MRKYNLSSILCMKPNGIQYRIESDSSIRMGFNLMETALMECNQMIKEHQTMNNQSKNFDSGRILHIRQN